MDHHLPSGPRVFLLSTYDLGHQPFALASLAASLDQEVAQVTCNDIAVEGLNEDGVRNAHLIAIHLAMHTATRLALDILPRLKTLNPSARYCLFGLYAPMAAGIVDDPETFQFVGGEFEPPLIDLVRSLARPLGQSQNLHLEKHAFAVPDRTGLPSLSTYAYLEDESGEKVTTGYTEASRGCKHVCRHCPVVPVYNGRFFVVPEDVVLADIRQQVRAGAGHISFGDPDFFNGPRQAEKIMGAFAAEFPDIGYDVTIKIEHLLKHRELLPVLKETGCRFITTAVESVDDDILEHLAKGHTREDFKHAAELAAEHSLNLSPTFIPFTPWTTVDGYRDLLETIVDLGLVDHVAPVQLSISLLIPAGSHLLNLPELVRDLGDFDPDALSYPWDYQDDATANLAEAVRETVENGEANDLPRREIFSQLWTLTAQASDEPMPLPAGLIDTPPTPILQMSEPWYCCAEPTSRQLEKI